MAVFYRSRPRFPPVIEPPLRSETLPLLKALTCISGALVAGHGPGQINPHPPHTRLYVCLYRVIPVKFIDAGGLGGGGVVELSQQDEVDPCRVVLSRPAEEIDLKCVI